MAHMAESQVEGEEMRRMRISGTGRNFGCFIPEPSHLDCFLFFGLGLSSLSQVRSIGSLGRLTILSALGSGV
jgi:hypothetical protein